MHADCQNSVRPAGSKRSLRIGGLLPMTTLDYPDHLACVLFCQGCAWNCRYCHNPELIRRGAKPAMSWGQALAFLKQRQGLLQAVVFSGGEATLQPALPQAMREVRARGFKVGLHSAGIKPGALRRVLPLCDWVGFDVKALEEDVPLITGVAGSGGSPSSAPGGLCSASRAAARSPGSEPSPGSSSSGAVVRTRSAVTPRPAGTPGPARRRRAAPP